MKWRSHAGSKACFAFNVAILTLSYALLFGPSSFLEGLAIGLVIAGPVSHYSSFYSRSSQRPPTNRELSSDKAIHRPFDQ